MNKQNTNQLEIRIDGELQEPTIAERAVSHFTATFTGFTGNIALQARMATFDVLHGTNYRQVRNQLVEQKRREEFVKSIGLVAVK